MLYVHVFTIFSLCHDFVYVVWFQYITARISRMYFNLTNKYSKFWSLPTKTYNFVKSDQTITPSLNKQFIKYGEKRVD